MKPDRALHAAGTADIVISNYSSKSAKSETEKDNKIATDSTAVKMISGEKENKSKKDSVISSATAKNNEKKTKESSWKWGVTGGVGSSNLNQNLFNSVKTLAPVTFAANPTARRQWGIFKLFFLRNKPGIFFSGRSICKQKCIQTHFFFSRC